MSIPRPMNRLTTVVLRLLVLLVGSGVPIMIVLGQQPPAAA